MSDEVVVAGARIDGWSEPVDVRLAGATIAEVGPSLAGPDDVHVIRLDGGRLIPGLHDHHIHLLATAADWTSVRVGPPEVKDAAGFERTLRAADGALPPGAWLRATAYHHTVAGDLDRHALDRVVGDRPLRLQDRSGARWTLNSAALAALDLGGAEGPEVERDRAGTPTGRVHRGDALIRARLPDAGPPDLASLGAFLASRGVTGVTDTTPYRSLDELAPLARAVLSGALPQRVVVTGGPELAGARVPEGLEWGPVKLVIDDGRYPELDDIAAGIATAHRHGRAVAIHCVTRAALALAVAAWDVSGASPGDRVEHGSVIPPELLASVVDLGLTVAAQPGFVAERGDDYVAEVDPEDRPHLYRCRSLLDAGVPVLGSTDAPYTSPDPWAAMSAAVERRTGSGAVLGPEERLDEVDALALFTGDPLRPGSPRRVEPGAPADLCLLSPGAPGAPPAVQATIRAGRTIWARG
jgi:predicted amidohydrolase YtcJ